MKHTSIWASLLLICCLIGGAQHHFRQPQRRHRDRWQRVERGGQEHRTV